MRIHSSHLTFEDLRAARQVASTIGDGRVCLSYDAHGSRKRNRAFEVRLTGDGSFSRRRPNTGRSGGGEEYAATWCAWGAFFAELFEVDPNAIAGPYNGRDDFNAQTWHLFADGKRPKGHSPKAMDQSGDWVLVKDGVEVARLTAGGYVAV